MAPLEDELDALNSRLQDLLRQGQLALDHRGPLAPSPALSILTPLTGCYKTPHVEQDGGGLDTTARHGPGGKVVGYGPHWQMNHYTSGRQEPTPLATTDHSLLPGQVAIDSSKVKENEGDGGSEGTVGSAWDAEDPQDQWEQLQDENIQLRLELQAVQQHCSSSLLAMQRECVALKELVFQLSDNLRRSSHDTRDSDCGLVFNPHKEGLLEMDLNKGVAVREMDSVQVRTAKMFLLKESDHPITRVKFANSARALAAVASLDGTVTVIQVSSDPFVLHRLDGHDCGVLDFDWSSDNESIVSVGGADKVCKLWETKQAGHLVKTMAVGCNTTCCVFCPWGSSTVLVSTTAGHIITFDTTTGQAVGRDWISWEATALCFSTAGDILFVGDTGGHITTYVFCLERSGCAPVANGLLSPRCCVKLGSPVTALAFQQQRRARLPEPLLLAMTKSCTVCLFSVGATGHLVVEHHYVIRSERGPVAPPCHAAIGQDSTIVLGTVYNTIMVIEAEAPGQSKTGQLYGHSSPVQNLAFNVDSSVLLSGDGHGMIMAWRRVIEDSCALG